MQAVWHVCPGHMGPSVAACVAAYRAAVEHTRRAGEYVDHCASLDRIIQALLGADAVEAPAAHLTHFIMQPREAPPAGEALACGWHVHGRTSEGAMHTHVVRGGGARGQMHVALLALEKVLGRELAFAIAWLWLF